MSAPASPLWPAMAEAEIDELGRELDELRREVLDDLGEVDARYIRRLIAFQRGLEAASRVVLTVGARRRWAWWGGVVGLTVAKTLENLEIGHNVMHGQWDWMADPKIHSTTWEWDNCVPAEHWKHTHNFLHHTYTNVLGVDRDLGYSVLRVDRHQKWHPVYLAQPFYNVLLALFFEQMSTLYDLGYYQSTKTKTDEELKEHAKVILRKVAEQNVKDYVAFPALAGRNAVPVLLANLTANLVRSVWIHQISLCGHFPGEVPVFTEEWLENETRGRWYLRQMVASCNFEGGRLVDLLSGYLSHQIEHHLYPDLPSRRYAHLAPRVREICERHGLPYHTGPFAKQVAGHWKKVFRMAFPGG
ncbi:fatty acid desaturase family protein [Thermomonospora umbrina]|uniref:Linoleoyl-CoA desaturase n=1 Tax=Thermomonospora umbrina TaxID=111806 RepID=A0A3D9SNU7_9ACTN|nr:acyl-CoA desaturase [Thermomonospora umbrina]REE97632.1 linoleoyl-CoA desaturase [Thermomonospora umbrina]